MMSHADRAEALFKSGYNCAQSMIGAFEGEIGIDFETSIRLAASFGGGMGRLREVCGALTGLFMVIGLQSGYSDPEDHEAKTRHYQRVQDLAAQFRDRFGTLLCRDLLELEESISEPVPEKRTEEYYQRRPCAQYIRFAASLLDTMPEPQSQPEPEM
ncbi:MAG: C-GCAxxG-C-C family protein [Eubacteriales bacterium]|nr:C-GCAxxG-C-C family protein [Eubacteriales bacterium]